MEDFDRLEKQYVKMKERRTLGHVLKMAQQSLSPEGYEGFVTAYHEMNKNRHLGLKEIGLGLIGIREK